MLTYLLIAFAFIVIVVTVWPKFRKWKKVYTVFGYEQYFHVVGKLKAAGISYKSKTPFDARKKHPFPVKDTTQYDIYVKNEQEHLALKVIHQPNR
jgi:hypothetical protein